MLSILLCTVQPKSEVSFSLRLILLGVRKQFLILEGEPVLAFINRGKKFTQCSSYTEVTTSVTCKVRSNSNNCKIFFNPLLYLQEIAGLATVDLGDTSQNTTASATTAAANTTTTTTAVESTTTGASTTAAPTTTGLTHRGCDNSFMFVFNSH